jgi:SAM-dependent methyltransferase
MGFGDTTIELCRAALPSRPIGSALDLGCGSGTGAIVLSRRSKRVVATDINPRAVALARVNAAINGVDNVDFRVGDLFEPVRGEAFDLVISQPPFVPRPEGAGDAAYLYGGARGDELALALIAGLEPHLAPRGRAVLFVEWPETGGEPLEKRLTAAAPSPDLDLLVLRAPALNLDHQAVAYAAGLHPALDAGFEQAALARLSHFAAMGIRELYPTLTVFQRRTRSGIRAASVLPVEPFGRIAPSSARIDKMMEARALVRDRSRLLGAALRVPDETVLTQSQVGPGAEVPSTLSARFAPDALIAPIDMTVELLGLVTAVHEAKSVRDGIARFAEMMEIPVAEAMERAAPAIEHALLYGLLEVERGA